MLPFSLPDFPVYVVAFSGGADSRLLLELTVRALLERNGEAGRACVIAAHLHHGIRGEEADRDLDFCRRVCAHLGVELVSERADVPALAAASGESIETAARRARYDFFIRVMNERGISALLTAHHADDNLETVLERLLRGSGTRGMGGIPAYRMLGSLLDPHFKAVYRPLLEWTKADILSACAELGLDYVTDSTNLGTNHTRNRIRHTVIPALEAMSGQGAPQRAAARMSRLAREDEEYLRGKAENWVHRFSCSDGDGLLLEDLRHEHPAMSKRMLAVLYEESVRFHADRMGVEPLSAVHLEALLELAKKGIPESSLTLPDGFEARVRWNWLYIRPAKAFVLSVPAKPMTLREGENTWGEQVCVTLEASPSPLPPATGYNVFASAVFPPSLPLPLLARKREAGDAILSHGMHKKLKKLLCDKDIPPHLRDILPLICLPDGEPLWYPAAAFRDGYPAPASGPCLRVTVHLRKSTPLEN